MRIIKTKVFTFDELTDTAKETARKRYREGVFNYDWWDSTYDDANTIGLKITAFDDYKVEAFFLATAEETAHKIEKEHGESCETYKDAKAYLVRRDALVDQAERDENGDFVDEHGLDKALDKIDKEFLYTLSEDYRIILQNEAEYMTSNEYIDEGIRANGYEFTEGGKIV